MTTVLKLGGSVVTAKDEPETVDEAALEDAARAVAASLGTGEVEAGEQDTPTARDDGAAVEAVADPERGGGLVIVHGGGSFGHHHAAEHGVSATEGIRDARGAVAVHDAMGRLNATVVERLHDHGVPALPVRPLSAASRDTAGSLALPVGGVEAMLAEGFCPVLHGDVVAHRGEGVTVLSGDDVVVALAESLGADRVGLCSTVPGVLDADGEVVDRIERFADVADAVGASDATDVTGGMAAKVQSLLELSARAHVFGPADLSAFLDGGSPGTLVAGGGGEEAGGGGEESGETY